MFHIYTNYWIGIYWDINKTTIIFTLIVYFVVTQEINIVCFSIIWKINCKHHISGFGKYSKLDIHRIMKICIYVSIHPWVLQYISPTGMAMIYTVIGKFFLCTL